MLKRVSTLVSDPRLGIPAALILAALPLTRFLGVALALLYVLRRGDKYSQLAYGLTVLIVGFAYNNYRIEGYGDCITGMIALFLPLWVMAMVLRRTQSLVFSLELGTLVLMVIVIAAWLLFGLPTVASVLEFYQARGINLYAGNNINPEEIVAVLLQEWPLGISIAQVLVLLLARWVQSLLYYPGGFRADFHQLRLHKVMTILALVLTGAYIGIVAVLSLDIVQLKTDVPTELLVLLEQMQSLTSLLVLLAGLGLAHWYVAFKGYKSFWLGGIYLVIFLMPAVAVLTLGVYACIDSFFNIRQRVIAAKQRGA